MADDRTTEAIRNASAGRATRLPEGAELPTPAGLKPVGQLDARFPVAYETSVPEAMRVMTLWMAALANRDPVALTRQLHFPLALFEGTEPIVIESAEAFLVAPPATLDV